MKPYEAQTGWVCTWFSHMCLVFCFPRFQFCKAIGTGNGLDSRANTALIFWRHEGLFIQRGAGGRISYSLALYPLNVVASNIQQPPSRRQLIGSQVWWMYMETTVKLALKRSSIQHYFSGAGFQLHCVQLQVKGFSIHLPSC